MIAAMVLGAGFLALHVTHGNVSYSVRSDIGGSASQVSVALRDLFLI
jgi:hypothetical protein